MVPLDFIFCPLMFCPINSGQNTARESARGEMGEEGAERTNETHGENKLLPRVGQLVGHFEPEWVALLQQIASLPSINRLDILRYWRERRFRNQFSPAGMLPTICMTLPHACSNV